jgi:hypothetical protein
VQIRTAERKESNVFEIEMLPNLIEWHYRFDI